jgi:hypothetical protein
MRSTTVRASSVFALVLALVSIAGAQTPEKSNANTSFPTLLKSFQLSLKSDVPGIVESTIYNLVQCKSVFPDRDYSKFNRTLDEIAGRTDDAKIAYKATLAKLYLMYGAQFQDPTVFDYTDHEKAFQQVADQLATNLLVSR